MNDLISVIMSTYNEDVKWIKESIDSILNQSYQNIEYIIVLDNPNNKPIKDILEYYGSLDSRIKIIINKKNKGLVKSLNEALQHCTGKYIARMDADDISLLSRLEEQKHYLESNELDFVFSGVMLMDINSNVYSDKGSIPLKPDKVKKLLEITNFSNHPTWFVKSEVYKNLGGYREVSYCEDYDFSLRSIKKGYRIGKMDKNLLKYRIRSNSISRNYSLEQFLNMKGILKLYKKDKLGDINEVNCILKKSQKIASSRAIDNYKKAGIRFEIAIKKRANKNIIGSFLSIILTCIYSKYYFVRCSDILKYKLLSRRI